MLSGGALWGHWRSGDSSVNMKTSAAWVSALGTQFGGSAAFLMKPDLCLCPALSPFSTHCHHLTHHLLRTAGLASWETSE